MKPSEEAKAVGLKNLKHMAQLVKRSERVLLIWHKKNPELFRKALEQAVKKHEESN